MSDRWNKLGILFTGALLCVQGQWLNYPTPGTPRTKDGKPDLTAKAPRASNGKPDLSGVWEAESGQPAENARLFGANFAAFDVPGDEPSKFTKYSLNIFADLKEVPFQPEALAALKKSPQPPAPFCLPMGVPWADFFNFAPFKIIQTPGVIAVVYEADNTHRQIYMDGRKLPADDHLQPSWLGYSVGEWQGDTLVVTSAGFNDKSKLDLFGHPHSEAMRVTERFHRRDFGHMDLEIKIEDPKTYTQPISIKVTELLIPDSDVLETICGENEKDRPHMPKP